ncbi:hypothetical protein BaRGS_00012460 [Batillaria attramentaria]|uniref:Uncharacterized protein n=1 Tax=Batillaria attramentaria TaxID=370345 RepID=A0ABD0LAA1_9CAEN
MKRKGTGTRPIETLVQGGSEGHMFIEAAAVLHREDIYRDLNYKGDLLADEAKYHASCYTQLLNLINISSGVVAHGFFYMRSVLVTAIQQC